MTITTVLPYNCDQDRSTFNEGPKAQLKYATQLKYVGAKVNLAKKKENAEHFNLYGNLSSNLVINYN